MKSQSLLRPVLPALLTALLSIAVVLSPTAAAGITAGVLCIALAASLRSYLPQLYLSTLSLGLVGYMFLGRGFAYLGSPPLYVGEILLGLGVVSVLAANGFTVILRSPLMWLLGGFMLIGAAATVPNLASHGLMTLRDAVLWGYGSFAIAVAALVTKAHWVPRALAGYALVLKYFLVWVPAAVMVSRLASAIIPTLSASGVPVVSLKSGDIGVHLAGALAFLVLGLNRAGGSQHSSSTREWLLWLLWFVAFGLIFNNRGGLLTVLITVAVLLLLHPKGRWGKHFAIGVLLFSAFVTLDVDIPITQSRTLSISTLMASMQSVVGETGDPGLDSTRDWRLNWWTDIVNYTIFGDYFWSGKGYGVNLADDDGYQVTADHSLRSPHNGHLTILARSGVPGVTSWLVLQGTFALMLLRAIIQSRRRGQSDWTKVNLWIFSYWLAFMLNGAFDVFLEGPQGGVWFWSIFGLGVAVVELQRRHMPVHGYPTRG